MKTLPIIGRLALAGCSATTPAASSPDDLSHALAPVFEADMPAALARLQALPEASLDAADRHIRSCVLQRFGAPADVVAPELSLPAPAPEVLAGFRRYWTGVSMKQMSPERAEARLMTDLSPFAGAAADDIDARSGAVVKLLEAKGLFALGGLTAPLRELMLWRKQTTQRETVLLPGGLIEVKVILLDDFVSLGWAAWGTCDRQSTGGWTTEDAIMVVQPSWDLTSEAYRVSLLAHEAQHFSDYQRFPKLLGPDLEFRAKLVELALADESQADLLRSFSTHAKRDRSLPHAFANHWVIERLRLRLGVETLNNLPRDDIRAAALAELSANTMELERLDRTTVETALPD